MPRVFARVDDVYSPPFLIVGGGTTTVTIRQINHNDSSLSLSSSSSSSSLIIVIIIIASSIIVTASLYLLLRFITRHSNNRSFAAVDDVVSSRNNRDRCLYEQQNSSNNLINFLSLFTFDSVTENIGSGDCTVCLSKFKRNDQLRLLPSCCHAFQTDCIDAWLSSNQTCLLCRSDSSDGRRSYSIGSFDYIVDKGYEVSVDSTHRRGLSNCTFISKDSAGVPVVVNVPPGENLASEVTGPRWLRDYVDRLASISSRTVSFRSSDRRCLFTTIPHRRRRYHNRYNPSDLPQRLFSTVASSIIVAAALYLLLRFITRHSNNCSFAAVDDVVSSRNNRDRCLYEQQNSSNNLINSLSLFTFGSVTGNIVSGDCAVCLSKFKRNDQLQLLPSCCHAFQTDCIDAWLSSNQTCLLCRSAVYPTEEDVLNKIILSTVPKDYGNNFQIEIGSVSRRWGRSDSSDG
ncbi:hypothetical protein TEA_024106 [Camellia sinensis var. sinensis]|uniref:RING-type domain-containing protein n=1 Tax=Camellia sinensis var. sinensis TaxID=542762 RepID=A0A4S4EYL9_CAMSN|nr:hypothetical protein TEA_024106 [Camellia sinensis var. sinensis]